MLPSEVFKIPKYMRIYIYQTLLNCPNPPIFPSNNPFFTKLHFRQQFVLYICIDNVLVPNYAD